MKFVLSNISLVLLASTANFIVDAHNVRVGHVTQEEKHGDDLDALEGRAYQDLGEAKANLERSELEFEQAEARLNSLEGELEGRVSIYHSVFFHRCIYHIHQFEQMQH